MTGDFETRRLEFADRLRSLREQAGRTGVELAATLGWQQSKISKIERGRQTPADSDVVTWLGALDAPESTVERMRHELRELRVEQITWRRQLRDGHRARQEHSLQDARSVMVRRGVAVMAVPGLLQTADYARAIFQTQSNLLEVPDDVEASVAARIERQRVLYDPTKRIEILMTESALLHPVCAPRVLAGQLDRLMSVIGLSTVRLGFLPAARVLPHWVPHGFWILDDVVLVETVSEELRIVDPEQVSIFARLTDRLWPAAVEGDAARSLLADTAARLAR
jgi:transcriptional regulator with XRE-family HTH domain